MPVGAWTRPEGGGYSRAGPFPCALSNRFAAFRAVARWRQPGFAMVIIAGWTTANPILYQAGLAFQPPRPKWSRFNVTLAADAIASVIGVFPGLCNG